MIFKNITFWIILLVCGILFIATIFVGVKPLVTNNLSTWQEIKKLKAEEQDLKDRQVALKELQETSQSVSGYYSNLSKLIPVKQKTGDFAIQIEALAAQHNLQLSALSVDPQTQKSSTTVKEEPVEEGGTSNNKAKPTPSAGDVAAKSATGTDSTAIPFTLGVTGAYSDVLAFIKSLEKNERLNSTVTLNLASGSENQISIQLTGKIYFKKAATATKITAADVAIDPTKIEEILDVTRVGQPIDLNAESGFGRENPFLPY